LEELNEFEKKDVEKLGLSLLEAQCFHKMLQHIQQQEEKKKGSGRMKQKNDTSSVAAKYSRVLRQP